MSTSSTIHDCCKRLCRRHSRCSPKSMDCQTAMTNKWAGQLNLRAQMYALMALLFLMTLIAHWTNGSVLPIVQLHVGKLDPVSRFILKRVNNVVASTTLRMSAQQCIRGKSTRNLMKFRRYVQLLVLYFRRLRSTYGSTVLARKAGGEKATDLLSSWLLTSLHHSHICYLTRFMQTTSRIAYVLITRLQEDSRMVRRVRAPHKVPCSNYARVLSSFHGLHSASTSTLKWYHSTEDHSYPRKLTYAGSSDSLFCSLLSPRGRVSSATMVIFLGVLSMKMYPLRLWFY